MERAKELFLIYSGNRFQMDREGEGRIYDGYHVPRETEERWAEEYILDFLGSEKQGKEALRAYSTAIELLSYDREKKHWEDLLYYPLRAEHLDDVTALFMLSSGFRMAERAVKKQTFSREAAETYLHELDDYIPRANDRAEKGTLTRTPDYVMREFSDPLYVSDYLKDLRKKWIRLCH